MNRAAQAGAELRAMDELASGDTPLHRIHPLVKLMTTIVYIAVTVSFPKYDFSGLMVMVLYPVLLFQISEIPLKTCFYKMRYVMPLILAVGLVNPLLDRAPLLYVGGIEISGGVISMVTLALKGLFSLMASFLLIATTKIDEICAALHRLHIPELLVSLLLLTYRYISVMIEQVVIMSEAYALRAPGQKGIHVSAWGSFLGQLLLRSMDKAAELYQSMRLRGFDGAYAYAEIRHCSSGEWIVGLSCTAVFLLLRWIDVAAMLGGILI